MIAPDIAEATPFPRCHATINHVWAALLLEELYRHGVRDIVVAPGSRSAPLAVSAQRHPRLCCHTHFDERGLGFLALGLSRASKRPVALITTSGSAVANLYPAIVEAYQLGTPLIALTADRPSELVDNGNNQAIDQRDIFARHVIDQRDFPPPTTSLSAAFVLSTLDHALARQRATSGPLHLNCRYREPLYAPQEDTSSYLAPLGAWLDHDTPWSAWHSTPLTCAPQSDWATFSAQRGVIVVGRIDDPREAQSIKALAATLGWPLLADLQSQLRFDTHSLLHTDLALLDTAFAHELERAEVLLQFGGRLISKRLAQFIARHAWHDYWFVDHAVASLDPDTCIQRRLVGPASAFVAVHPVTSRSPWHDLAALQARTRRHLEGLDTRFSELGVCHRLCTLIKGELFVGNSLPARVMNMLGAANPDIERVLCNRGASGIDGLIASACGVALTHASATTLLLGDVSALHDLNSLALVNALDAPFIVIVLNNAGGSIFHLLPVPADPQVRDRCFVHSHDTTFRHAAAMFGLAYQAPTTLEAFEHAYRCALGQGATLIEVRLPSQEVADELDALRSALSGMSHDA
ncbi:2-succinyl-5-enolpyruvyl-6-hydroxy-3-cyclohexene-1-carboxylic-acid synthase [Halomonas dongshanensis]|uniref:2-succinyl-5-enolpyruvyl-6-hydroxy-3-cyclohexene-1-carboxylate synthase n=1 Tax=Halomonas dongshanensis TaxID=2890835 RepID=A0ABT2EHE4_9GAMM|nr:2-succinyl-5-enolpyruvyl-6-hydroxy-3-cyclohexene-1-carboxylic-acid synthase [Halomonas dongshanensis]MCS2610990.1 2-succinyl-5-enolpyruvyl-6-hydroxy-3-cyclohexene-1-carboxylic-acid synthase [Halomonas dongshanensis]